MIWTTDPEETGIDIYLGAGGAPEGVLAAAALRCIGGQIEGRLLPASDEQRARVRKMGIADVNRKFKLEDMASSDVIFSATGVTDGSLLDGVRFKGDFVETETRRHARAHRHGAAHQDDVPQRRRALHRRLAQGHALHAPQQVRDGVIDPGMRDEIAVGQVLATGKDGDAAGLQPRL